MSRELERFPIPNRQPDVMIKFDNNSNRDMNIWFEEKLLQVEQKEYCFDSLFIGGMFSLEKYSFDDVIDKILESNSPNFKVYKEALLNYYAEKDLLDI